MLGACRTSCRQGGAIIPYSILCLEEVGLKQMDVFWAVHQQHRDPHQAYAPDSDTGLRNAARDDETFLTYQHKILDLQVQKFDGSMSCW